MLYRGYIANCSDLIAEAEKRGEAQKQGIDGELFAKAYRWWGEKLQLHVLGEYAVSIFDDQCSSLFITHDSLGLVPLFYAQQQDGILFASHLEDLVFLTGINELDEEYLADYLATAMVINPRTPFVNVCRLAPGQSLHWINGRPKLRTTWDLARIEPVVLSNDEEYEERFRTLLHEGVTAALRTKGRIWCELSGGLDSSTVTSVAARSGTRQFEAFSIISTRYRSEDEREWMKAVVNEYSLPWQTLDLDQSMPFSELPQGFHAEPISIEPAVGLLRRYKALAESQGVHVVLTGLGGDGVLCGGSPRPYYLADFLPFQLMRLSRALRDWRECNRERRSLTHLILENVFRPLLMHLMGRNVQPFEYVLTPPWSHPDYLRARRLKKRSTYSLAPKCRSVGEHYHAERILNHGFAAGRGFDQGSCSFEFRNPILYRPLVEFMFAIPWEQKIRPNQDRYLQRRALKGILPEPIRQRSDKGGGGQAYAEGLRKGNAWTELLLAHPRIVERGYVDANLWGEAVKRARFGVRSSMKDFLAAATLEVWLRQLEDFRRNLATLTAHRDKDRMSGMGSVPIRSRF
ncbi:MAG: asparagine synthase-related protein [Pseudomonadota bacterium]|nr:asparagine synthase-related protein [Pseudomonadota bacterium]